MTRSLWRSGGNAAAFILTQVGFTHGSKDRPIRFENVTESAGLAGVGGRAA